MDQFTYFLLHGIANRALLAQFVGSALASSFFSTG
jgi:hypothetical protein